MVLRIFLLAGIFFFMSCTEMGERDNPDDPNGNNYQGKLYSPSSSAQTQLPSQESSSSRASSSSSKPSSSSAPSSSSSVASSSSEASSSSSKPSSSSAPSSSSSVASSSSEASSSSSKPSSSSAPSSSSSVALSSSGASSSSSVPSSSSVSTQANIVYGADVTYQGATYKTVKIGSQTWFQRNLNYNVSGSKCGGSSLSDANTKTCDTYGRLYDWATAMALPSKCNSKLSTSDADCAITTPHKSICPTGWHIPSDGDWDKLMTAVGDSSTAGKYLKATSGWNSGGNGVDKFGFAALPGGYGNSVGDCHNVGNLGHWWSASEYDAGSAYHRDMHYYDEGVYRYDGNKGNLLFSVRCLQD